MSSPVAPAQGRVRQIFQAYRITKEHDRHVGLILLAWFILPLVVVALLLTLVLGHLVIGIVAGVLVGLIAVMSVFGRRAERAAYASVDGQAGAAASALQLLKRGWDVKPAVAVTKNQDCVHRVVGTPGIVLVGEGQSSRVRNLLANEKKKHARVAGQAPIYDIVVGSGKGEIPVPKLVRHIRKLPRNIRPADMTELLQRLKALDVMRPAAPLPKGPVPTSLKGSRRMMQGR